MTVAYAAMPAGALLAGLLATTFGIRTALWILTALISASGLLYLPTPIRRLRDLPRDQSARSSPHGRGRRLAAAGEDRELAPG